MENEELLEFDRPQPPENTEKTAVQNPADFGEAGRIGMLVGALLCVAMVLLSVFVLKVPVIALTCWTIYFAMQGSGNLVLYLRQKDRSKLIIAGIELVCAVAFLVAVIVISVA